MNMRIKQKTTINYYSIVAQNEKSGSTNIFAPKKLGIKLPTSIIFVGISLITRYIS